MLSSRSWDSDVSCPHKSRFKSAIVSRTFLNRRFGAVAFNTSGMVSFLLYPAVLPSFIWWDKLTKINRSFSAALSTASLILKSFLHKLVWCNSLTNLFGSSIQALWWKAYMSYLWQQHEYLCLSYQLYIDSVVAELFHCHLLHLAVPVSLVSWSHELISCCFLELISFTTPV